MPGRQHHWHCPSAPLLPCRLHPATLGPRVATALGKIRREDPPRRREEAGALLHSKVLQETTVSGQLLQFPGQGKQPPGGFR